MKSAQVGETKAFGALTKLEATDGAHKDQWTSFNFSRPLSPC